MVRGRQKQIPRRTKSPPRDDNLKESARNAGLRARTTVPLKRAHGFAAGIFRCATVTSQTSDCPTQAKPAWSLAISGEQAVDRAGVVGSALNGCPIE